MIQKGFTLIELLIVVAIIAILAAIAVPNFLEAQMRAKVMKTVADMRTVANAISMYELDHHQFPITQNVSRNTGWVIDYLRREGSSFNHMGNLLSTPVTYISEVPYDYFNTTGRHAFNFTPGRRTSYVFSGVPLGAPTSFLQKWWDLMDNVQFQWNWFMESCGPDLVWWENWGSQEGKNTFYYDPTNGTISKGQIVTFEGNVSFPKF